jgi:hypothetical protein
MAKKASSKLSKSSKFQRVMKEWKRGTLKSSSGKKITSQRQALAVAFSEARKAKKKG